MTWMALGMRRTLLRNRRRRRFCQTLFSLSRYAGRGWGEGLCKVPPKTLTLALSRRTGRGKMAGARNHPRQHVGEDPLAARLAEGLVAEAGIGDERLVRATRGVVKPLGAGGVRDRVGVALQDQQRER